MLAGAEFVPDAEDTLLAGRECVLSGESSASRYAAALLLSLGARPMAQDGPATPAPALLWATSGLMWLSGPAAQGGSMLPTALASCAQGVLQALAALGAHLPPHWQQGPRLLGERAALLGLRPGGRTAAGGACRLLEAADGMLALNLARTEDWGLLPAWLEHGQPQSWDELAPLLRLQPLERLLERGRLLGLPVADGRLPADAPPWCRVETCGEKAERTARAPRVLDLSSLWAGPLCAQLLHQLGAQVVKVESIHRPDGARAGNQQFFDRMHAGKYCVALDFRRPDELERLRRLIDWADIVIEASRPRALRQFGIDAETMLAQRAGLSWISITGYGRGEPQENWVAFGDDAGVGAGLSALFAAAGEGWAFAGDAIADPLTGLHAALAAWSAHQSGGGVLLSLALRDVVRHAARWECPAGDDEALRARAQRWHAQVRSAGLSALPPRALPAAAPARALGADNTLVDELLAC